MKEKVRNTKVYLQDYYYSNRKYIWIAITTFFVLIIQFHNTFEEVEKIFLTWIFSFSAQKLFFDVVYKKNMTKK